MRTKRVLVMAIGCLGMAALAVAQQPVNLHDSSGTKPGAVVDVRGCLGSPDEPCLVTAIYHAPASAIAAQQQASPVIPPPSYPNPQPIPCAGCSPGGATAIQNDPIARRAVCSQAYQDASFAIDALYGLIPGISKDEQLVDSISLADAAELVARDSKADFTLCSAEKLDELRTLTIALLASRDELQAESESAQRRDVGNRAAQAVRDMKRWLP